MLKNHIYLRLWPLIVFGLITGCLLYRYYAFSLFYTEQKKIVNQIKKTSLEYREVFSWLKRKEAHRKINDDHPRIVITIEKD